VLTHAYQQGEFMSNKKLGSCPIGEKRKKKESIKFFLPKGIKRKKIMIF